MLISYQNYRLLEPITGSTTWTQGSVSDKLFSILLSKSLFPKFKNSSQTYSCSRMFIFCFNFFVLDRPASSEPSFYHRLLSSEFISLLILYSSVRLWSNSCHSFLSCIFLSLSFPLPLFVRVVSGWEYVYACVCAQICTNGLNLEQRSEKMKRDDWIYEERKLNKATQKSTEYSWKKTSEGRNQSYSHLCLAN